MCGTGGFLAEAYQHLEKQCQTVKDKTTLQEKSICGGEAKPLPYMLAQMNLLLHGLHSPNIAYGNSLAVKITEIGDKDRVDVILTNPPFGGEEEAGKGHEIQQPTDLIKDPYVLEFTGLPQGERYLESNLEQALIDKLREFLLELGKGFAFMARQQRITLDGQHYWIDLVFYNRLTRCFVLIDLKVGMLTHQDLGQMQMYVNYYQRELTAPDENPPIGIVLCTDKSEAVVRYTLPEGNQQIFAARYKLYLPTEAELAAELQRERRAIELHQRLRQGGDDE